MSDADFKIQNKMLAEMCRDEQAAVADRADALIYSICDKGLDFRPTVRGLLEEADIGRKFKRQQEAQDSNPLASEIYVGKIETPRLFAVVTRGPEDVYLPTVAEDIEGLQPGDSVLVDFKANCIVSRDGQIPRAGDVVVVDSLVPDDSRQVIVKHHEQCRFARLHHTLMEKQDSLEPGIRVLYDPLRRFVLDVVEAKSDGTELLADLDSLGSVKRTQVGAPNPVVDEIIERVTQFVEHPDWIEAMYARPRVSYLFAGGTGTGKSYTLKLIANEVHDLVEKMTGERHSRMVICDASQFWHSLFGETEQRIAAWADKLRELGAHPLRGLDGRLLHFPLFIVLEECEALLRIRGDQTGSGHLFDRPLALLLQKTESLEDALQIPIVWLASSNRPDLADPAALRRIGMRRVTFGNLGLDEAAAVLETKIPEDMPIRGANGDAANARNELKNRILGYLYSQGASQGIAEVQLTNSERRTLHRYELVTPSILEESVSGAIDACLRQSHRAGELLGLDAEDVIRFLHRHYVGLARTLTRHNLPAHCPEWFEDDSIQVSSVSPLTRRIRRLGHG